MTMISIQDRWIFLYVQVCKKEFTESTNRCLGRLYIIHRRSVDAAQVLRGQSTDVLRTGCGRYAVGCMTIHWNPQRNSSVILGFAFVTCDMYRM